MAKGSPERDYQRTLVATLEAVGYQVNWTRPVHALTKQGPRYLTPTTAKGWPDLTAVGVAPRVMGVVLAIEVKSNVGRLDPGQLNWLRWWHQVPCAAAMCLRPRDPWDLTARMFQRPASEAISGYGWLPEDQWRHGLVQVA